MTDSKKNKKKDNNEDNKKYRPQPSKFDEEAEKLKKQYIQKYYSKPYNTLYEAVLMGGRPYFVNLEWDLQGNPFGRLIERIPLPEMADKPTMQLVPPEKGMYLGKPFEFESEDELNRCLKIASVTSLDSLFKTQKKLARKYIDAPPTHITITAADDIFSFFQDLLGQCHYLFYVGDNDTGKSTNLTYLQYEGYRAMLSADITTANIYSFLGNFEEGQGIILEDEADNIHKQSDKMRIYKVGYNSGKTVPRTDVSNYGRKQNAWYTYCFKAFTAEEAPDNNKAKGFLDRTFTFHCVRGSPDYDIQEVTSPAGDDEFTELLNELNRERNILFCYRLLHYGDPIPNIELSVKNREKQLCKPLLRLFQDAECKDEIGIALAEKIGEKRGLKRNTLESKILDVISNMIDENIIRETQRKDEESAGRWVFKASEPNQLAISSLIDRVRMYLEGEYRYEKDKSFQTEEHGTVSHDKIRKVCVDKFGAESIRSNSVRYLGFSQENLRKAKEAYQFPEKVTILQKNVSESGSDAGDRDEPFYEGVDEHEEAQNHEEQEESHEEKQNNSPAENDKTLSPLTLQESSTIEESNDIEEKEEKENK